MLCKDEYDVDNVESSSFKDVISAGSFSGLLKSILSGPFGGGEVGEGGMSSATSSLSGSISMGLGNGSIRLRA